MVLITAGVVFFVYSIAMTGMGAMGFAKDAGLAGWGALGSFGAAVISILSASACIKEEKKE